MNNNEQISIEVCWKFSVWFMMVNGTLSHIDPNVYNVHSHFMTFFVVIFFLERLTKVLCVQAMRVKWQKVNWMKWVGVKSKNRG